MGVRASAPLCMSSYDSPSWKAGPDRAPTPQMPHVPSPCLQQTGQPSDTPAGFFECESEPRVMRAETGWESVLPWQRSRQGTAQWSESLGVLQLLHGAHLDFCEFQHTHLKKNETLFTYLLAFKLFILYWGITS